MKFTFVGCSFTVGVGLELEKSDPANYTNIVGNYYGAESINLAQEGNSNYNIFITALNEIIFNSADKIFVQWSALNRLWLWPGPDTAITLSHIIENDYSYRNIKFSKKELQKFSDMYHILNHDYHNLITLTNYCNILTEISKNKTQIIFINGLIPWTEEITDINTMANFAENLSEYSKEILEFNSRDDIELTTLFNKLNLLIMGLDKIKWVNMFNSMMQESIDYGNDNTHPGPKSHRQYAEMIINYLEGNNDKRI